MLFGSGDVPFGTGPEYRRLRVCRRPQGKKNNTDKSASMPGRRIASM
jgi:hypothetical protein